MDNDNSISLNKFISSTGLCSRREADKLIEQGRVSINRMPARKGNRVKPKDRVLVDGRPISDRPESLYLAFHKPVGIVCTTDAKEKDNIIKYLNYPERLFPIGRLDKLSEGLIFLTNDGDIVNKILRAGNAHEKEYIVTVDKTITDKFIKNMSAGVQVLDRVTRAAHVEKITPRTFKIILTQGLNRQIRRMCTHLGFEVTKLKRTRVMHISLDHIPPGEWREFSESEIDVLHKMIEKSSNSSAKAKKFNKKPRRTTTAKKKFGSPKPKREELSTKGKPKYKGRTDKNATFRAKPKKKAGPRIGKSKKR